MKPYGQKKEAMKGKVRGHSADKCAICSNHNWKISKKRVRRKTKEKLKDFEE